MYNLVKILENKYKSDVIIAIVDMAMTRMA